MSGLKLYADSMSPVCRSVMLFLAANDISYESVHVNLGEPLFLLLALSLFLSLSLSLSLSFSLSLFLSLSFLGVPCSPRDYIAKVGRHALQERRSAKCLVFLLTYIIHCHSACR